jgi:hypothetical protein
MPAAQRRHVGRGPGLVDDVQARRIKLGLMRLPAQAAAGDVGPILLACQRGFF